MVCDKMRLANAQNGISCRFFASHSVLLHQIKVMGCSLGRREICSPELQYLIKSKLHSQPPNLFLVIFVPQH